MARLLTPKDAAALLTLIGEEMTAQNPSITGIDTSDFVSAGETMLSYGTENVLNAAAIVLGRYMATTRPYEAKLRLIQAANHGIYSTRLARVSYYSKDPQNAGNYNTDLFTNFADGFDNGSNPNASGAQSTASMWRQNQPDPVVCYFGGSSVWQDSMTIYDEAFKYAFRSPEQFAEFWNGALTEKTNDMEMQKEAFNRAALLNYMGGLYDMSASMPGSVIDLTTAFNAKYGTQLTRQDLLSTHLKEFTEFFVTTFKKTSRLLTVRSKNYHWTPDSSKALLRNTPFNKQKCVLYAPLFDDVRATVFPEIFNPEYLSVENYEGVDFWQNMNDGAAIKVTPAIPNVADPTAQTAGTEVSLPYVVGVLFDEDACLTDFLLDRADSTPLEARKHYRNIWYSYARNIVNDFTMNGVLFIMS